MEGYSCNEATKHDVPGRLMTKAADVVVEKEAGAAALPSDHTPQEK